MIYGQQNTWYLEKLLQATRNSYKACGYQQLVVAGTAVSLTIPAKATMAIISLESNATGIAIRYLELGDKTLPTSTTGVGRSSFDAWSVTDTSNLTNFRAIQAQGGTHTLNIQYYSFE